MIMYRHHRSGRLCHKSSALRGVIAVFAIVSITGHVGAAEIKAVSEDKTNIILISGKIEDGDSGRFRQSIAFLSGPANVVVLNSPGGSVRDGLEIGTTIRLRGYSTAVMNSCASVCGLIWLAGVNRYISSTAHVGFHAAYTGSGSDAQVSGPGNALIGGYLNKLGLSDQAIVFVTMADPNDMKFLHPDDARAVGIEVSLLPDPQPQTSAYIPTSPPTAAASPTPSLLQGSLLEQRVERVALTYYAFWSSTGTKVDGLADFYSDTISYFGSQTSRATVMDEKRKFAVRWPSRQFKIQSISASCINACTVDGTVAWDTSSDERNDHSVGTAKFSLIIAASSPGSRQDGAILSENGSVVTGHKEPLHAVLQTANMQQAAASSTVPNGSPPPSFTPSFRAGKHERELYESWFSGLPNAPYREGASFGVRTRSDKPQPACAQAGALLDWQQGCFDARARLAVSDIRRGNDADYRAGWNSL